MHTVVETPTYLRSAKRAGMTDDEMAAAVELVSRRPNAGDMIVGTGGARKVRLGRHGSGKSGGYRIVTYYAAKDVPVFLLDVYSKGDRIDISQSERNELARLLPRIAAEYRDGARRRTRGRRRS